MSSCCVCGRLRVRFVEEGALIYCAVVLGGDLYCASGLKGEINGQPIESTISEAIVGCWVCLTATMSYELSYISSITASS